MQVKIMEVDTINKNNRIYSKEVVQKALSEYDKKDCFIRLGFNENIDAPIEPKDIAGIATNSIIENNIVYMNIKILDTPPGMILKELIKTEEISYVTAGVGKYNNGKIDDFRISYIAAVNKKDSAWED